MLIRALATSAAMRTGSVTTSMNMPISPPIRSPSDDDADDDDDDDDCGVGVGSGAAGITSGPGGNNSGACPAAP